jgi:hypothetical protein
MRLSRVVKTPPKSRAHYRCLRVYKLKLKIGQAIVNDERIALNAHDANNSLLVKEKGTVFLNMENLYAYNNCFIPKRLCMLCEGKIVHISISSFLFHFFGQSLKLHD